MHAASRASLWTDAKSPACRACTSCSTRCEVRSWYSCRATRRRAVVAWHSAASSSGDCRPSERSRHRRARSARATFLRDLSARLRCANRRVEVQLGDPLHLLDKALGCLVAVAKPQLTWVCWARSCASRPDPGHRPQHVGVGKHVPSPATLSRVPLASAQDAIAAATSVAGLALPPPPPALAATGPMVGGTPGGLPIGVLLSGTVKRWDLGVSGGVAPQARDRKLTPTASSRPTAPCRETKSLWKLSGAKLGPNPTNLGPSPTNFGPTLT